MNLRSVPQRIGTSLVIVIGIAGVVAVLVSVLAMSTGMIKTMRNSGREDRAVVLRNGSVDETSSALPRDSLRVIMDSDGVKRDEQGKPIASAEALRILPLFKKEDNAEVNVLLRGVGPQVLAVRPEMRIIAGRMFEPALREVIVGKSAQAQFKGLEIGDKIRTRFDTWTVVGAFESGGDSHESEIFGDGEVVVGDRRGGFQAVTVVLESPGALQKFKDSLSSNPTLAVDVHKEREFYEKRSENISRVISIVAYVVGGIMAVGAIFGALNTMYSAVSARLREIATLRAIGFGAAAVVTSVLVEALLLAGVGGLIGTVIAWLLFNGHVASTSGGGIAGQLVFELSVSPQLVIVGVVWACAIGLIGGLFPAVRAARLPVATALRAI